MKHALADRNLAAQPQREAECLLMDDTLPS